MSDYRSIEVLEGIIKQMHVVCKHKQAQVDALRGFAQDVMQSWPEGDVDGADLEAFAITHGLLKPEKRTEPCGESCNCTGYYDADEWAAGIDCNRYTKLLKEDE